MTTSEDLEQTVSARGRQVDVDDDRLKLTGGDERYEHRRTLGQGGMGTVDLVFDLRIGRELAVKKIRKEALSHPESQGRFLREARVQGQLDHPAVVPVFDLGVEGGEPFFTMRRINGVTLEEAIGHSSGTDPALREKYGRRRLLTAFVSACLAIDYAHSRGVLHRDLKPSNVMLGDFGEVYLLDWGIAKVSTSEEHASPVPLETPLEATANGAALGTIGYMAPEQLRGDLDAVGPCSDVYSLGAVLFEILAHEPLHPRTTRYAIEQSTLSKVDARPSMRLGGQNTPHELDLICSKATQLFPADRYASTRELATAVERYLDGEGDLERRRSLARQHVERAEQLAARMQEAARTPGDRVTDRKAALRELGQALSFDPTSPGAMGAMLSMLNEAPRELPADLLAEFARGAARDRRWLSWVAALTFGVGGALASVVFSRLGVRSLPWTIAFYAVCGVAAVLSWLGRDIRKGEEPPHYFYFPGLAVVFTVTALFGPLLIAPMVAGGQIVGWAIDARGMRRWIGVVATTLAWLVPWVLELTGVFPPSYRVADGVLTITSRAAVFVPGPTELLMLLFGVMAAITLSAMVGQFRDQRSENELQRSWTAWQLRHLMPETSQSGAHRALNDYAAQRTGGTSSG
ncbi:MAG: protein kinase [Myxococcaceae bacterium]